LAHKFQELTAAYVAVGAKSLRLSYIHYELDTSAALDVEPAGSLFTFFLLGEFDGKANSG
jgi:hypothetical protein